MVARTSNSRSALRKPVRFWRYLAMSFTSPSSEYHYDHVSALRPVLLLQVMVFLHGAGVYRLPAGCPRQRIYR